MLTAQLQLFSRVSGFNVQNRLDSDHNTSIARRVLSRLPAVWLQGRAIIFVDRRRPQAGWLAGLACALNGQTAGPTIDRERAFHVNRRDPVEGGPEDGRPGS